MQRELLKSLLLCISVVIINIAFLDNFNTDCKYWYWNERSEGSCSHNPVFDCLQKLDRGESLGTRLKYGEPWGCACKSVREPWGCARKSVRIHSQQLFLKLCDTLSCFHTWVSWKRLSKYALHVSTPLKYTFWSGHPTLRKLSSTFCLWYDVFLKHLAATSKLLFLLHHHRNMIFLPPPSSSPLSPPLHWQARQRLMQRLAETEEQYDGLRNCHSETEIELANTRASLNDRKTFCQQLQDDCENITKRVSSWADDQR